MKLIDLIQKNQCTSVSIVGLAKNVGKTVTLNRIIDEAQGLRLTLGLLSTGRDGERLDVLTRTDKPPIYAPAGCLVVTARQCLARAQADLEIVEATDFSTPWGPLAVARVRRGGEVEVAGINQTAYLTELFPALWRLGAELVIVDGAFDRQASAAPHLTDGLILATGAALSPDMAKAVERTYHAVCRYNLPPAATPLPPLSWFTERQLGRLADGLWEPAATVEGHPADGWAVGGALTPALLSDLLANTVEGGHIIVHDGTRVFLESADFTALRRKAVTLSVMVPARLLAVTANPWAPAGPSFPAKEFYEALTETLAPIPVFDLVAGYGP